MKPLVSTWSRLGPASCQLAAHVLLRSWAPAGLAETWHKCCDASCDSAATLPAASHSVPSVSFESYLSVMGNIHFSKILFL